MRRAAHVLYLPFGAERVVLVHARDEVISELLMRNAEQNVVNINGKDNGFVRICKQTRVRLCGTHALLTEVLTQSIVPLCSAGAEAVQAATELQYVSGFGIFFGGRGYIYGRAIHQTFCVSACYIDLYNAPPVRR